MLKTSKTKSIICIFVINSIFANYDFKNTTKRSLVKIGYGF